MFCYVSGCPNANNGSKESKKARMVQIFFSAPEDESLFKLWQSAVPKGERHFTREDKLCDFHFKKSEVILFNETKLPNGNVRRVPASEPKLKAGTIPSIFPEQKVSSNEDSKKTGNWQKTSNAEGQKLKQKRKLSTSDESDGQEYPPPAPRSRGRQRKCTIGDQVKKNKTTFDKHRKQSLSESTSLEEDLNKGYESDVTNSEDVSQGMQPSIRLVPLSSLLAPSPTVPEQKPKRTVRLKSTGGPLLKKARNKKKAVGRNATGPASAKKVKFADTELSENESVTPVRPEPVKPSQERKQMRKDLNRVEEELQHAIDDMNENYEIEHITDPGDTEAQDDNEIFEIMSIKSDPDDLEQADTMQEPRITQVISLRDLDEEDHPLLKKLADGEPVKKSRDIEREIAEMLGEESVKSPEPHLHAEKISNTEILPVNDGNAISKTLIDDQPSVDRTTSVPVSLIDDESSVNKPTDIPPALISYGSATSKSFVESDVSKNEESVTNTSEPELPTNDESSCNATDTKSKEPLNNKSSPSKATAAYKSSVSKTRAESEASTNETISRSTSEPKTLLSDESFTDTSISEAPLKVPSVNKATPVSNAPLNNELPLSKKNSVESEAPVNDEPISKITSESEAPINDESSFIETSKSESPIKDASSVCTASASSTNDDLLAKKASTDSEMPILDKSIANKTTKSEVSTIHKSLVSKMSAHCEAPTNETLSACKATDEPEVPVNVESIVSNNNAESKAPYNDKPLSAEDGVLTQISDKDESLNMFNHRLETEDNKDSSFSDKIEEHSCAELAKENTDSLILDKGENSEEILGTKVPEESLSFVDKTLCIVSSNEKFTLSNDVIECSEKKQSFVTENIESATSKEPCLSEAPENSVKSTALEEICHDMEDSLDDVSKLEMKNNTRKTNREETNASEDATVSEHLLNDNISQLNDPASNVSEPEKSQKVLNTREKNKKGPFSSLSSGKKKNTKNAEVPISKSGRKRKIKKHGESFSDDDLLSPSSPECVLDISSDSEADPNWAPNADAFEVSDDNDTDPECIGVNGDNNTEKSSKTGTESVKTSKISNEFANVTQTVQSSKPTTTVPPEVSRILTQDTLQQILKTLKLPLDAPVSFNIGDGTTADSLVLPTEPKKTYSNYKDKPISARGRPPKLHLHDENIPGKVRQSRKVQISVERSKRCEKLLGIKMFEGLGKIKKAFDFSTFLTDADDELQFKKFCLVVRECLRDVCESKNAVTNIGKLTLKISRKTVKSQMPIPDLEPLSKAKDTAQPSSDASKKDSLPESTGDEAEMFECMTVDSNVENHYENTPNIENAMEEDMLV